VAEDEGDLLRFAEVGESVPGEQALAGDGEPVAEGGDGPEEGARAGGNGLGEDRLALGVEDVPGQGPGVQIDAAVESVLLVVEPRRGLPGQGVEAGYFKCASRTEAMMSIPPLQPTAAAQTGSARGGVLAGGPGR
jgi:hypothetical protein